MDEYKRLAAAIKETRIASNMSQEEFAEMLDVSSTHFKHMESGHRKPSVDILFRIARKTGMSIDRILYDKEISDSETYVALNAVLALCTEKEKTLIVKIAEAIIANR